eukprot:SAG11_NODE_320_length_10806_cov_17.415896_6_plen_172_part_00
MGSGAPAAGAAPADTTALSMKSAHCSRVEESAAAVERLRYRIRQHTTTIESRISSHPHNPSQSNEGTRALGLGDIRCKFTAKEQRGFARVGYVSLAGRHNEVGPIQELHHRSRAQLQNSLVRIRALVLLTDLSAGVGGRAWPLCGENERESPKLLRWCGPHLFVVDQNVVA